MTGTTMSDPNDFAAQLILVLPFLLLVVVSASQLIVIRIVAAGVLLYGIYLILLSGSRGALIAICVTTLFVLVWRLRPRRKDACGVDRPTISLRRAYCRASTDSRAIRDNIHSLRFYRKGS